MEDQLISFETAKLAKEKGFNEPCLECYVSKGTLYNNNRENVCFTNKILLTDNYSAPTQSLLQKWLREVHDIIVIPCPNSNRVLEVINNKRYDVLILNKGICHKHDDILSDFYEKALEKGLQEALNLL